MVLDYVTGHPKEAVAFIVMLAGLAVLLLGLLASTDRPVRYRLGVKIEIDQMAPSTKRTFETIGALLAAGGALLLFLVVDRSGSTASPTATLVSAMTSTVTASATVPLATETPEPTPTPTAAIATATPSATPAPTSEPAATDTPVPSPAAEATASATPGAGVSVDLGDGDTVAQYTVLTGACDSDLTDDIWLLVRPANGLYYPQSSDACAGQSVARTGGRWEVLAAFGEDDDAGEVFEVVLVTADPEASALLSDTIARWCLAGNYPGLEELPEGTTVEDRVQVVRGTDTVARPADVSGAEVPGSAAIATLDDGETVPESLLLGGTISADASGSVWVLVYPHDSGRWYPQSSDACAGIHTEVAGDEWQVMAHFGSGSGATYEVAVLLADEEANAELAALQEQCCRDGSYPGLRTIDLPVGIEEKARIAVQGQ